MKKQVALLSSVVVASSLLTSFGSVEASEKTTPTKQQALNLAETTEISSLDSSQATDQVSFLVMNNVFEGLLRIDANGKLTDGMAEMAKTEKSADGLVYTFHLRDAKWSNGTPVTANDFVYAWRKLVDPRTAAEYAYIMYDVKNAAAINDGKKAPSTLGVTAIDDKTFKVELEQPIPYFEKLVVFPSFFPQNEQFVSKMGGKYGTESTNIIYNGPFILSDWKHEERWTYKKNPTYWDTNTVKLEQINVSVVKDSYTTVNLYETNSLDRINLISDFVEQYKTDPNFKTENDSAVFFLRMNTKKPLLANVKVRKAIAMSINKTTLTNAIFNNGSTPANGLVPSDFITSSTGKDFRNENGNLQSYKLDTAKKLWQEAKKELKKEKLTLELLVYDGDTGTKIGAYLKSQLEENLNGLMVKINTQPFKQKLDLESAMKYDLTWSGWGPDYPDPMTFLDMFVTDSHYNQTGWSNTSYDRLINSAKTTLSNDGQARWRAMLTAEKILMDQAPIAPLYQRGITYLEREYVHGIVNYQFGADYSYKWAYMERPFPTTTLYQK